MRMQKKSVALLSCGLLGGMYGLPTFAANWADKVTISGFTSAVYRTTNEPAYFNGDADEAGINEDGSWQGSRAGLNINARLTDKISVASQFFASREEENFVTSIDWSFISYSMNDEFTLRTGKIKFPAGLVNEYVDVGIAYPWIAPPTVVYSEEMSASIATFESYSGASALFERSLDDITYTADAFYGEVPGERFSVRKIAGAAVRADWDDMVLVQLSYHTGTTFTEDGALVADGFDDQNISSTALGARATMDEWVGYAEYVMVDTDTYDEGEATAWYVTAGYQMENMMPHVTYQYLEKGVDSAEASESNILTIGVRYDLEAGVSVKAEVSQIETKMGEGLFEGAAPASDSVTMMGVSFDVVF